MTPDGRSVAFHSTAANLVPVHSNNLPEVFVSPSPSPSTGTHTADDFDGDGKSDPAIFRPSTDLWVINFSRGGKFLTNFGDPKQGDIPAPGDYDGDGKTDLAVFRPSTARGSSSPPPAVRRSTGSSATRPRATSRCRATTRATASRPRPLPAQHRTWIIRMADGSTVTKQFGDPAHNDLPVPGDYEGIGKVRPRPVPPRHRPVDRPHRRRRDHDLPVRRPGPRRHRRARRLRRRRQDRPGDLPPRHRPVRRPVLRGREAQYPARRPGQRRPAGVRPAGQPEPDQAPGRRRPFLDPGRRRLARRGPASRPLGVAGNPLDLRLRERFDRPTAQGPPRLTDCPDDPPKVTPTHRFAESRSVTCKKSSGRGF